MHDFRDDLEMDEDGRLHRKKKRVLPDGATMQVPMGFYDGRFHSHFSDGTPDHTNPHQKGFRFSDVNDTAKIAADAAYEERNARMRSAWQRKGEQQDASADERTPSNTHTPSLDARQVADQAYEDRNKRLRNAWRHD